MESLGLANTFFDLEGNKIIDIVQNILKRTIASV